MPKGVYPRRPRTAKPVKRAAAAKPAAPAKPVAPARPTTNKWEFIESDPTLVRLNAERKEMYSRRDDLKREISAAFRKIRQYEDAINVLEDKVVEYQDCDESEETIVHKITGHYAECFASSFSNICEDMRQQSIAKCREIAEKSAEVEALTAKADANWELAKAQHQAAEKDWNALISEVAK